MKRNKMTREDAIELLKGEQCNCATDYAHKEADDILCKLLLSLGYKDVVDEYRKVDKWYA